MDSQTTYNVIGKNIILLVYFNMCGTIWVGGRGYNSKTQFSMMNYCIPFGHP